MEYKAENRRSERDEEKIEGNLNKRKRIGKVEKLQ